MSTQPKPQQYPSLIPRKQEKETPKPEEPTLGRFGKYFESRGFIMAESNGDQFVIRPTLALWGLIILLVCVALLIILVSYQFGFDAGKIQTQQEQLKEEIKEAKEDAKTAKEFGIKNAERQSQANSNSQENK